MYKLSPAARRILAAYTAADDATRAKLARGRVKDGKPLPQFAKPGMKAATSAALTAWRALTGPEAYPAYADLQLMTLRITLRNPKLRHKDRLGRPMEGKPPELAAADLEVQSTLIAVLALDPGSFAYPKLTAKWRAAGLPL